MAVFMLVPVIVVVVMMAAVAVFMLVPVIVVVIMLAALHDVHSELLHLFL